MFDKDVAERARDQLVGCVYTIFTPFDANENVDYDSIEAYLRTLHAQGARRFYAMAYNSRYSQMTMDEIFELNRFCAQTVKKMDPESTVIVGDPIHCSTKHSVECARAAREAGADLISVICREKYFEDDQVLEHFATVGRESGLGVLVHEMPFLSGQDGKQMNWPISLLQSLARIPEVVALKEDAKEPDVVKATLELEPRIRVVLAGRKSSFLPYHPLGARAYLNGISIIDARIGENFWAALEGGDERTVRFILEELESPFFDELCAKYGWHRCNKALLEAAGFMSRRDRMPLKHLLDERFAEVSAVYKRIEAALARAPWMTGET
ncbi:dihydrodipicolinate synthase family protein [uncultured Roseibium sp.]|uniref:dihydrodipicolinate synthase family protein n=1 Tax=uncultured Roseibium sp. TaxID=1936171 RepID=UPI00261E9C06|nr:dihydrodipicolinate synthase family protein [uncultured Roseibium sp.]